MFREVILFRDALTPNGPKKMNRTPKHPIRALLTALLLGLGACGETGTLPATEETPETARDAHVLALADAVIEAQYMDFPTEADKVRYINALVGRPPWIETIADNIIEAEYMDFPTETERQDYVNALLGRPPGATPFFTVDLTIERFFTVDLTIERWRHSERTRIRSATSICRFPNTRMTKRTNPPRNGRMSWTSGAIA